MASFAPRNMERSECSQKSSPFPLFDLPLELLEHIYSYLNYSSICILARTHPSLRNVIRPRLPLIRIKHYEELVRRAKEYRHPSYACWYCLRVIPRDNYWLLPLYYTSHTYGSVAYRFCPRHCDWQLMSDLEKQGINPPQRPWRTRDRLYSSSKRIATFLSPNSRLPDRSARTRFVIDTLVFIYSLPTFAVAVAINVEGHLGNSRASMLTIVAVSDMLIARPPY